MLTNDLHIISMSSFMLCANTLTLFKVLPAVIFVVDILRFCMISFLRN